MVEFQQPVLHKVGIMSNVGRGQAGNVYTGRGSTTPPSFQSIGTNSGLTQYGVLLGGGVGPFTVTNAGTSGYVLTSAGAGSPPAYLPVSSSGAVTSVTAGPGITITGTATAPVVNSVVFTNTTATTLVTNNGYYATAAGTYVLPAAPAQGDVVIIVADTAGAVAVDAPSTHLIRIGNLISSAGGTATSTAIGDSLTLRYRASSTTWFSVSTQGNWTLA